MDPLLESKNEGLRTHVHERRHRGWPNSAMQVRKLFGLSTFAEMLFDVVLAATAILFLVYGILAQLAHGQPIESALHGERLLSASRFGPTIFPIAFALTAGRLMKAVAAWRIERGADLATLEQLLGSRAIGSTVITLVNLRSVNVSGLLLLLLWTLSPLGGQASLRTPSLGSSPTATPSPFSYIDFNTTYQMGFADYRHQFLGLVQTLYSTALIGSATVKGSPQDAWGNTKVPMIETMPGYDVSEISKWLPVNSSGNVTYSSLLGLPVTPQTTAPNTSYNVDTMYMSLTCKNLKTVMAASQGSRVNMDLPPGWAMVSNNNDFALATVTDERHMNAYGMPKVPRPIEFQTTSWIGGEEGSINIVSTSCNLTTSYVELNISCVGRLCSTVAIRPSQEPHDPVFWSVLDTSKERTLNTSLNVLTFLADFVNATKSKKAQASSATEYYLVYPNRPFSNPSSDRDYWVDFSNTTTNEFETRFAQLLNSYYLANIVPLAFAGDLSVEKLGSSHNQYSFRNTTGELSSPRTIFVCNQAWLSVLLVSSLAMMGCAVASAVFCLLRRGPDIIDSFSSITRDNPYMSANVPLDGSNIDGISRTRYLKGIKVKLGDVAPEGDVGHIAIGTPGTQKIATLRRGRLFE